VSEPADDERAHTTAETAPAMLVLACMWGAYVLNYADRQAVFSMFPSLRSDLGMDDAALGLVGAVFLWTYALGCPVAGFLGDRLSKHLLAVGSIVLWSLVTIATGLVGGAAGMLACRAILGVAQSLFMPTAVALVADAHPPRLRSRAIAMLTTAQIVGTVTGTVFGGWMADLGRWRHAFLLLGGAGLVYAVVQALAIGRRPRLPRGTPALARPPRGVRAPAAAGTGAADTAARGGAAVARRAGRLAAAPPLWTLLGIPSFLALSVAFPCFVFGLWLIYGWLPTFLHDKFSLSQRDAAWDATVYLQPLAAVGLLGGGLLSDWLYRRTAAARQWVLVVALVGCAPALWALATVTSLEATRLAAAAFGLSSGLFMGTIFAAAFEVVAAELRASAVGLLNLAGGLVSGFGALFGGVWKQSLGIDGLLAITAAVYLAAAVLLVAATLTLFRADHAHAAGSPP
jgi:MFS family permease